MIGSKPPLLKQEELETNFKSLVWIHCVSIVKKDKQTGIIRKVITNQTEILLGRSCYWTQNAYGWASET